MITPVTLQPLAANQNFEIIDFEILKGGSDQKVQQNKR